MTPIALKTGKGEDTQRSMPTNLSTCDIRFADLSGANLSGANLCNADLRSVTRKKTVFEGAKLDGVLLTR